MPRSNPLQPSYNAGELSPRLHGRTDFQKYQRGLETCENLITLSEGGAMRRAGFRFVSEVKNSAVKGRMKPFRFSTEQAYTVEMGDMVMRFYRHQGPIVAGNTDAVISNGTFDAGITDWDNLSAGTGSIAWDAVNQDLELRAADVGNEAAAEQDMATTATGVEHVLKFRVKGAPGDAIKVRVGSASGAENFYAATSKEVGYHCIPFTPTASPFYIRFTNSLNKTVSIDDISLIDNAGVEIDTPYLEADLFKVEGPQSADVVYLFHNSYATHKLQRLGHTEWSLVEVAWQDGPYLAQNQTAIVRGKTSAAGNVGGTTAVDTVGRTEADDFWNGKFLYLADGANAGEVRAVTDFVKSTGTLTVGVAFTAQVAANVAYEIWPTDDLTTMTPSALSGNGVTITASAVTGINDDQGFLSTDVGRVIRVSNAVADLDWGWGVIVGFASPTSVTVDVKRPFKSLAGASDWRLGAWSATTGYPGNGAFYEQRLAACRSTLQPQTFWMSNTADFENMAPDSPNASGAMDGTVEDDDALDYTISADDVNAIFWMSPGEDTLVLGTAGGQWVPQSIGAVLTPTDIVVRKQTSHKCAQISPVRIDNVVLFVQRARRKVREFGFAFEVDGFRAPDMTRLAQHITRGGIVEMAYQEEPDSLVWAVREDGQLLSMTYRREEDVVGWSRHIIGGSFSGGSAVVESVAVIPGADGAGQVQNSEDRDEVWVIVKRTINGQTKRYIEVLEGDWDTGDAQADAYHADSCITYDGVSATTITGLSHLEGETVKVLADGAIVEDKTVTSGQIVLSRAASVVQIGLGYTHKLKTLKIEGGTAAGTAVGKTKKIAGITFVVLNSHTLRFGPSSAALFGTDFRKVSDAMDAAAPYFTGEKFLEFDGDWETDPRIHIESADPAPFTLLAMAPENSVNEVK